MSRRVRAASTKLLPADKKRSSKSASATAAREAQPTSKIGKLVTLLRRAEGASLAELMKATSWQAHSVRGAIAGTLKKKHGLAVTSTRGGDGQRVYAIR